MESYPRKYLCISLSLLIVTYSLGIFVSGYHRIYLGFISAILGLVNILTSMKFRCTACYYYSKRCTNGFGLLVAKIFKKRQPDEFQNSKDVIITLSISMINTVFPIIIGVLNLIEMFSGFSLSILLIYIVIAFVPNFLIRPNMCTNCKQGELGCPAYTKMNKT